ncbi:MAG: glycosyltransferase family 2 protein [bacterium]|nr:glycosyltransferase family 2 protein [bacterium]
MILHVIILNYKNKDQTIKCVDSISDCNTPPDCKVEILVVDNASGDGVERIITNQYKHIQYIQTGANLGYTGGNNAGIRTILEKYSNPQDDQMHKQNPSDDFIFIVNNDTYFKQNFLIELLNSARRHPKAGIISPKIYFTKNSHPKNILDKNRNPQIAQVNDEVIWYAGGKFDWDNVLGSHRGVDEIDQHQYDLDSTIDYSTGCALLITVSVLQQVYGFDTKFFMYYEDVDLSMRIKSKGYELWYCPQAIMWHENASASSVGSTLQTYFTTRNRLLIALKYAPLRAKLAVIKQAWGFRSDPLKWKAVSDFFKLNFEKGSFEIK